MKPPSDLRPWFAQYYFKVLMVCLWMATPCPGWSHMGARFEPDDGRVVHGLGQYVHHFYTDQENWQYVDEYIDAVGSEPLIYSVYAYLDPDSEIYQPVGIDEILEKGGRPFLLNVGISLHSVVEWQEGSISVPVQSILAGEWDHRIQLLADQIKSLNAPTFVRPGFEFGVNNNGAHAASDMDAAQFKAIWIHIHDRFIDAGVDNVAWVWNTVNPWMFDYMQWYPGDSYVDWWGINYFTTDQMRDSDPFLESARLSRKPVMICEASPILAGGTTQVANWAAWFEPFFEKIRTVEHLKGFIYISDPWDRQGWWEEWADSRINRLTTDVQISSNYMLALSAPRYIHMQEYLDNPGTLPNGETDQDDNSQNDDTTSSGSGGGCLISVTMYGLFR